MEIATYLLQSFGILSIFYLVYYIFLRKDTHFNIKRHFFIIGVIASCLLPFLEITQTTYVETEPIANVFEKPVSKARFKSHIRQI